MTLHPFDCTIRIFDPRDGALIAEHVLPVNSPDEEHAAASTLVNAASFTIKTDRGAALPIAFSCTRVAPRL